MFLQHWGATQGEIAGPVTGDALVGDARLECTRATDLDTPPSGVWPWLVQMGYGRAGWYSYDGIDNLGRRSATRVHPEWQSRGGTRLVTRVRSSIDAPAGRFIERFLLGPGDGVMVRRQLLTLRDRTELR